MHAPRAPLFYDWYHGREHTREALDLNAIPGILPYVAAMLLLYNSSHFTSIRYPSDWNSYVHRL